MKRRTGVGPATGAGGFARKRAAVVSRQMSHTMYYKLGNKQLTLMCAGERDRPRAGCERDDAATKSKNAVQTTCEGAENGNDLNIREYVTVLTGSPATGAGSSLYPLEPRPMLHRLQCWGGLV